MGSISINAGGKSVVIKNGEVFIDGERVVEAKPKEGLTIKLEGSVNSLQVDGELHVDGDVNAGVIKADSINCGDVSGNIDAMSVNCGDVDGNVSAKAVNCGDVGGNVSGK